MRQLIVLTLLLYFTQMNADAAQLGLVGQFMPDNDMQISVDAKFRSDMTQERFNQIIAKVEKFYAPIVAKKMGKLVINRKWTDNTVNANASRMFFIYNVNMYGGLARHPLVTDDGFALVVCHELGHHLGGAPKINQTGSKWASNEGQSDFWGALKCFKRVFSGDDNITVVRGMRVNPTASKKCQASFGNAEDIALCERAAMAGYSLAQLLGGSSDSVNFDTPDTSVVSATNDRHPDAQCRLDTYFAGSLCDKDFAENVNDKDPNVGVCNLRDGDKVGTRPLCWFKP